MLEIVIPGKPLAKQRARITKKGFSYTPSQTVNYEVLIRELFISKYSGHIPFDGAISLQIMAFYTIPASMSKKIENDPRIRPVVKPDLDNIAKITMDALNSLAWRDDKQIISLCVSKFYSDRPRLVIQFEQIELT